MSVPKIYHETDREVLRSRTDWHGRRSFEQFDTATNCPVTFIEEKVVRASAPEMMPVSWCKDREEMVWDDDDQPVTPESIVEREWGHWDWQRLVHSPIFCFRAEAEAYMDAHGLKRPKYRCYTVMAGGVLARMLMGDQERYL